MMYSSVYIVIEVRTDLLINACILENSPFKSALLRNLFEVHKHESVKETGEVTGVAFINGMYKNCLYCYEGSH